MLVHRKVTPSIKFARTHLYTWVERGTVRVKCLAQEHNTMSPARVGARTARSGDERTNHEATAPPTIFPWLQSIKVYVSNFFRFHLLTLYLLLSSYLPGSSLFNVISPVFFCSVSLSYHLICPREILFSSNFTLVCTSPLFFAWLVPCVCYCAATQLSPLASFPLRSSIRRISWNWKLLLPALGFDALKNLHSEKYTLFEQSWEDLQVFKERFVNNSFCNGKTV